MALSAPKKSAEGNTILQPKKRCNEAKRWCFTWNNYPNDWEEIMAPKIDGLQWIAGKEIGESGTPHLQGYLEFVHKKRPSTLNLPKEIHWEAAKGNRTQNIAYCTKDGVVRGTLPYDKPLVLLRPEQFYDWQNSIYDILKAEPDDRTINWVWETVGSRGKSSFVKFCVAKFGGIVCSGKSADMKYLIVKFRESHGHYPKYIFYDIPRTSQNYVSWSGLEEIKNGCFASTKYESEMVLMNSPHIVCFANFEPDYSVMSQDRWNVICLEN
jgi:hypothetical protein